MFRGPVTKLFIWSIRKLRVDPFLLPTLMLLIWILFYFDELSLHHPLSYKSYSYVFSSALQIVPNLTYNLPLSMWTDTIYWREYESSSLVWPCIRHWDMEKPLGKMYKNAFFWINWSGLESKLWQNWANPSILTVSCIIQITLHIVWKYGISPESLVGPNMVINLSAQNPKSVFLPLFSCFSLSLQLQVYWVAPIVAGLCVGNSYYFIFSNDASRGKLLFRLSCQHGDTMTTSSMRQTRTCDDNLPPVKYKTELLTVVWIDTEI